MVLLLYIVLFCYYMMKGVEENDGEERGSVKRKLNKDLHCQEIEKIARRKGDEFYI